MSPLDTISYEEKIKRSLKINVLIGCILVVVSLIILILNIITHGPFISILISFICHIVVIIAMIKNCKYYEQGKKLCDRIQEIYPPRIHPPESP